MPASKGTATQPLGIHLAGQLLALPVLLLNQPHPQQHPPQGTPVLKGPCTYSPVWDAYQCRKEDDTFGHDPSKLPVFKPEGGYFSEPKVCGWVALNPGPGRPMCTTCNLDSNKDCVAVCLRCLPALRCHHMLTASQLQCSCTHLVRNNSAHTAYKLTFYTSPPAAVCVRVA